MHLTQDMQLNSGVSASRRRHESDLLGDKTALDVSAAAGTGEIPLAVVAVANCHQLANSGMMIHVCICCHQAPGARGRRKELGLGQRLGKTAAHGIIGGCVCVAAEASALDGSTASAIAQLHGALRDRTWLLRL